MNLNQVTIYTEVTVETVEFFEKLGLIRIVDSLPRYARLECPDGEATLSVSEAETRPVVRVPSSFNDLETLPARSVSNDSVTLYFECTDVDAEYNRIKSLGLKFTEPPTDRPWLWRQAYLLDPNGNKICLFQAGENRKNPPWRVK